MSANKQRGTRWESSIVDYLRTNGVPHAERRVSNGTVNDRGDIAGIPGVVIEAKNAARVEMAAWLDEAERERRNDNAALAAVWIKRRLRTDPADGFVVLSGATFVGLLRAAGYIAPSTQEGGAP